MQIATALIYWIIIALWLAVLATVATAYIRNPRTFGVTRLLLVVVGIDTLRNIIENLYFGFYFGAQYGIFPNSFIDVLGSPNLLIVPKLINVLAASVVLSLLLLRWLPLALEERSRAEEDVKLKTMALSQEIEERRRVFETSLDLIVIVDPHGTLVQLSKSAESMLGYGRHELLGQNINEFVLEEDLESVHLEMELMRQGNPMRNTVMRLVQKNSKAIALNWMGSWSEPVNRFFLVGRDMTESYEAEEALRQSERMSRGIVETALDSFVQLDARGTIIDWSTQAEKLFGFSRDEAVGIPFQKAVQLGSDADLYAFHLTSLSDNAATQANGVRIQIEAKRKTGETLKIELSISLFKRQNDYVFNAFMRDLTDKIAAENKLRQAQKMETVGQLTGGVAHDFNNILTVITGTIGILAEEVADRPDLVAITNMIDEAAARGADLTRHLLAYARRQPLKPENLDLNILLLETEKLLRPTIGEQVRIETILSKDPWLAYVDSGQLTAAILNLAINARDAMPQGGTLVLETLNVFLDQSYAAANSEIEAGDYILLAVSDTGTGISRAIVDNIFEPFFTTKEVGKGTGLGLSMVYGFVKQSGGHIKVYSEEGQGTTFKLYFPRSAGVLTGQQPKIATQLTGGNELVLVVEDDLMVRNYVVGQLGSLGYRTLVAADAQEALKILGTHRDIHLLFTDVIMPGSMNGPELVKRARELHSGIKVLYTSGYTENAIIHNGRLDAGVLLLPKPYHRAELAQMLRTALNGSSEDRSTPRG